MHNSEEFWLFSSFHFRFCLLYVHLLLESQLNYIQNKNLGFNKDNIGYFMYPAAPWDPELKTVKKELLQQSGYSKCDNGMVNKSSEH